MQDTFAEALGTMVVITDMYGTPLTRLSNPCELFKAVSQVPRALQKCCTGWARLANVLDFKPRFCSTHLGLQGTRGLIRVGTELKGMVVVDGIAPEDWHPAPEDVARYFNLRPEIVAPHLLQVRRPDAHQRQQILTLVQQLADSITHLATDRAALVGTLETIAQLVG